MSVTNPIIGAAEREFAKQQSGAGSGELDKMAFLNLLVAQLQHQDPLNPMDDTAFIAQLAQFTQLETLNNISSDLGVVIEGMGRQENLGASSFIGKYVESYGDQISVGPTGQTTELYYHLSDNIVSGQINIMDGNSGDIIRTITLGEKQAGGPYPLSWDGLDYKGKKAPEGVYLVGMSGFNKDGTAVTIASEVSGKVDRVFFAEGTQWLGMEDGRVIMLSYVTAIRAEDEPETLQGKVDRLKEEITAYEEAITVLNKESTEADTKITYADGIINSSTATEAEKTAAEKVKKDALADKKSAEAKKLIAEEELAARKEELKTAEEDLAKEKEKENKTN